MDKKNLTPGDDEETTIRKAVQESEVFITCISHHSVNQKGSFNREIIFALDVAEEQAEDAIFIIPVLLDNIPVPDRLKRWHKCDYFKKGGYDQLVEALLKRSKQLGLLPVNRRQPQSRLFSSLLRPFCATVLAALIVIELLLILPGEDCYRPTPTPTPMVLPAGEDCYRPTPTPTPMVLPVIDNFDGYASDEAIANVWKIYAEPYNENQTVRVEQSAGIDATPAMRVFSYLACAEGKKPRYLVIERTFNPPLDFRNYNSLIFQARGDGSNEAPQQGVIAVALVEAASEEIWQSQNSLDRSGGWKRFVIALRGEGQALPSDHPNDFTVPDWFEVKDGKLDLSQIGKIGFHLLTPVEECENYPEMSFWIDNLLVGMEEPTFTLDTFDNYADEEELKQIWGGGVISPGTFSISLDMGENLDTKALKIETDVPCVEGRYAYVDRHFSPPLDLSTYHSLIVRARGDDKEEEPLSGILAITLWDTSNEEKPEAWRSQNQMKRTAGWQDFVIALEGEGIGDTAEHPSDFVIPDWSGEDRIDNQVFEKSSISRIEILAITNDCRVSSKMVTWIDSIVASTAKPENMQP